MKIRGLGILPEGRSAKMAKPRHAIFEAESFFKGAVLVNTITRRGPKQSVSIFYPCYNDWGTMGSMVLLTLDTAERLGLDYDLTIVDDGSKNKTLSLLHSIEQRFPKVNIVRHDTNRGYGGALRTGFASASREWIFYTDGDAQYDVRELETLLTHAGPDVDVVQGYKITRHDPLHRIVIGRVYHWLVRLAFGLKLRDVDCDFRLIRRTVFDRVALTSDSGVICAEMMTKFQRAGCRIVEVPVHHYPRAHGKSQFFNVRRVTRVAWQLRGLWLRDIVYPRLNSLLGRRREDHSLSRTAKSISRD